jgi:RNA polymerase sigma factor, sigma-70 family
MELPDKIEQEQRKSLIHAAIDKLPEPQKAVFLLKYGEDLTITEIAKVCDIPEGTVKSRMFSALKAVREYCKLNEI